MAYGYVIEAQFEDGFTLTEDETDQSPYDAGHNVFHAITNGRAEARHGPMVRFSLIPTTGHYRYDIDWVMVRATVDDPRPVYYRDMTRTMVVGQDDEVQSDSGPTCEAHYFGYQFLDAYGANQKKIEEIR